MFMHSSAPKIYNDPLACPGTVPVPVPVDLEKAVILHVVVLLYRVHV